METTPQAPPKITLPPAVGAREKRLSIALPAQTGAKIDELRRSRRGELQSMTAYHLFAAALDTFGPADVAGLKMPTRTRHMQVCMRPDEFRRLEEIAERAGVNASSACAALVALAAEHAEGGS